MKPRVILGTGIMAAAMGFVCAADATAADRFFVSDYGTKQVYKYTDEFTPSTNWATAANNGTADDVFITDTEVYVLDSTAKKVFRYDYDGGNQVESRTLKVPGTASAANIGVPKGMSVDPDANELWITDESKIYRFSLSSAFAIGGSENALNQYNLHISNTTPQGLALDDTYAYVLDYEQSRLFRYLRSNPAVVFTPSRKFRDQAVEKLTNVEGIAVANDLLYVLNNGTVDNVYLYSMTEMFIDPHDAIATLSFPLATGNSDPHGLGIDAASMAGSIVPSTVGPTNLDSITFTVKFGDIVTGFNDADDLVITNNGTVVSTNASITGAGDEYVVTIDGISGDGTFTLAVDTTSDVITDDGRPVQFSAVSPAVLIDNTAPRAQALNPVSGTEVEVFFLELNGMSADALLPATYVGSGTGLGTLLASPDLVTDLGSSAYRLTWNTGNAVNGDPLTVTINPLLTDLAGNLLETGFTGVSATAVPVSMSGFSVE